MRLAHRRAETRRHVRPGLAGCDVPVRPAAAVHRDAKVLDTRSAQSYPDIQRRYGWWRYPRIVLSCPRLEATLMA